MEGTNANNNEDLNDNFDAKVPFYALCDLFEKIFTTPKTNQKKEKLQYFFSHYKSNNFFPLLRLLLPQLDKERQTYGMKETNLGKYYVNLLNISPESEDGRRLLHWRRPTKQGEMEAGDFGNAVYLSLKKRCIEKGTLSIAHINRCLDQLNITQEKPQKLKILKWLIRKTSAREQKWAVRIILKELKIGLSEKTVLNSFHPDALEYFQMTSNLRKVVVDLRDIKIRISNFQSTTISLFHPIKPMLAARKNPDDVLPLMDGHRFVIETKFDGERIQVHKKGSEIKIYSRNSNDVTPIYGQTIIPILLQNITVSECILDGELLVWDSISQRFEDFGKLKTFATFDKNQNKNAEIGLNMGKQLCYIIFDLLFVNEKSILDLTLQQRSILLKRCIKPQPKLLEIVDQKEASTVEEIITALDTAIMNREEGIMIKNLDSIYVPGERKEKWIKLKPEYIDGLVDDIDLLIVGGYYGTGIGRRGGTISHFMLAVPIPPQSQCIEGDDQIQLPSVYYSFCKIGSGYTDQELKVLQKMLERYWRVYDTQNPPSFLELAPPFKEKPDVWIDPKKSKVLQVKAAQLVPSEKFRTGFTLRFPRVQKLRLDKNWNETLTFPNLLELVNKFQGQFSRKKYEDITNNEEKKPRKQKIIKKQFALMSHHLGADVSNILVVNKLFEDLEFCVYSGSNLQTKAEIEQLIYQFGGTFVQNPIGSTFCVISAKVNVKINNLITHGRFDVVKPKWIFDCINSGSIVPFEPKYMIFTKDETKEKFMEEIDRYGDSFSKDCSANSLKEVFDEVGKYEFDPLATSDLVQLEKRYINVPWWAIFRNYLFYIDRYAELGNDQTLIELNNLDVIALEVQFYGANIATKLTHNVTHIIIDPSDTSRLLHIRKFVKRTLELTHFSIHVLSKQWALECISKREDLDEKDFYI